MKPSKRIITALLTMALLGGGAALAPSAASASVSQGYVYGANTVTDDFGDEGPLDSSSHRHSNATALWQLILWADGLYTAGIDCDYGPATTAATKAWQDTFGSASDDGYLVEDGSAGPKTMGTADQWLVAGSSDVVTYIGAARNVNFKRVDGTYQVYLSGAWRNASYNSASC